MENRNTAGETRTVTHLPRVLEGGDKIPPIRAPGSSSGLISQGATLGRYIVLYRIGSGGMGEVYAAYDPHLDRKVAIKVLRSDVARQVGEAIRSEASALARLVHPNVVTVFDLGEASGRQFIAMELLSGRTLKEWLADESPRRREIVDVFMAAGRGLAAAHEAGLVHHDFKPSNVMLTTSGEVKVLDFGLAVEVGGEQHPEDANPWVGTPRYMAPERQKGYPGDASSDQYGFCAALHEAMTGRCPELTTAQLSRSSERAASQELSEGLPRGLRQTLRRGLAEKPEDRFADLPELLDRLTPSKPRRGLLAAAALVLVGALLLAALWPDGPGCDGGEDKLVGLWDSVQKGRLEASFLATKAAFAAEAWRGVESALDRYTISWKSMHAEACEATHVRGVQSPELLDRRMLCLDRRLQGVRSLTTLLLDSDLETLSQAAVAVDQLSSLELCADQDRLTNLQPLPENLEVRSEVTRLYQVAADQLAAYNLGQRPDFEALTTAVADAQALDYPPLEGEVSYVLGRLQLTSVDYHELSEDYLVRALEKAIAGRDQNLEVRAMTGLVAAVGQVRFEEGEVWERLSRAALAANGAGADELRYELETSAGLVDWVTDRRSQATEHFRKALFFAERVWGPEHPRLARPLGNLGLALGGEGLERAITILEKAYGSNSPLLPIHLINRGSVLAREGSYEEARALLRRCNRLLVDVYGEDSRQRVTPLTLLGRILMAFDRPWEAEPVFREALALASAHKLESTSRLEISLAKALHLQGRDSEARPLAERMLAKVDQEEGAEVGLRIEVLIVSGGVAREIGALEEADRNHRQAVQLVERTETDLQRLELLVEAAETHLALRRPAAAVPLLEDGLALIRPQIDRGLASRFHFALARAISESEPDRAHELATAARALLQDHNRLHRRLDEAVFSFLARGAARSSQPRLPG